MARTLADAERLYACILVAAADRRRAHPCWTSPDGWGLTETSNEAECDAVRAKHDRLVDLARRVLMVPHGWEP